MNELTRYYQHLGFTEMVEPDARVVGHSSDPDGTVQFTIEFPGPGNIVIVKRQRDGSFDARVRVDATDAFVHALRSDAIAAAQAFYRDKLAHSAEATGS